MNVPVPVTTHHQRAVTQGDLFIIAWIGNLNAEPDVGPTLATENEIDLTPVHLRITISPIRHARDAAWRPMTIRDGGRVVMRHVRDLLCKKS
jgi:hypothetical protein